MLLTLTCLVLSVVEPVKVHKAADTACDKSQVHDDEEM